MFIYFDRIYTILVFVFEMIMFILKDTYLAYPSGTAAPEVVGMFFLLILQLVRLHLGSIGNKTEISMYLMYSIFLTIPVILAYVYYLWFQLYVLLFDLVLCIFGLVFIVIEIIVSIYAVVSIKKNEVDEV